MDFSDKRALCVFGAIATFFAGSIVLATVPNAATVFYSLVTLLTTALGFVCGFFYMRQLAKNNEAYLIDEISSLTTTNNAIQAERTKLRAELDSLKLANTAVKAEKKETKTKTKSTK